MRNSKGSRFLPGIALAVLGICLSPLVGPACDTYESCGGYMLHAWCDDGGCNLGCYCTGGNGCVGYTVTDTCRGMIVSETACCEKPLEE